MRISYTAYTDQCYLCQQLVVLILWLIGAQLIYLLFLRSEYCSQAEKHDSAKKTLMLLSEAYLVLSLFTDSYRQSYSGWIYEELKEHSVFYFILLKYKIYICLLEKSVSAGVGRLK